MYNAQRYFLSASLLAAIGCQAQISGTLPTFSGDGLASEGTYNIVWSGAVPRRISIAETEPFRGSTRTLALDTVRQAALDFVTQNSEFLRSQGVVLRVESVDAQDGHHHAFLAQTLHGRPVFNAGMDIVFTDAFQLEIVHNQLATGLQAPAPGGEISSEAAAQAALALLVGDAIVASAPSPVLGYEVIDGEARPVYRVRLTSENPDRDDLVLVDARSGQIQEVRDLLTDVTARGNVFPNGSRPLSNPTQVTFDVDGSGFLRAPEIDVQVGSGARATSNQNNFSFSTDDARFGEVNTFFHLQGLVRFLKQNNSAAITERFPVRVRGVPDVNAFYDPSRKRMVLGAGEGIDLSFDGDVAVHEYGHALLDRIRPGLIGSGLEAGAIHEAFGDVLAAYYFRNPEITEGFALDVVNNLGVTFHAQICPGFEFSSERPFCRNLDSSFHYPEDVRGEVHFDSMIVSAALWEVFEAMTADEGEAGRNRALKTLTRAANFLPSSNARFTDLLAGMVEADRALNGGRYRATIIGAFHNHGVTRPDLFECARSSECETGDLCNADGFCESPAVQNQACTEEIGCGEVGLSCVSGVCIPSEGGSFAFSASASGLPLAIPDNSQAGTSAVINVPVDVTVKRLQVRVGVAHTFSGDLTVSLIAPNGTVFVLHDREGGSANDVDKLFEVEGVNGLGGFGDWTLRVIDRAAQDSGSLNEFQLFFNN